MARLSRPLTLEMDWSVRWKSNPNGRPFKTYKIRRFVNRRSLRAIDVRIFAPSPDRAFSGV